MGSKYTPFPPVNLPDRKWPNQTHEKAPIWCSVDLRDGNQALAQPMSVDEKLEYFSMLVSVGFKEIEIGFPSASQIEFDFCRRLIEEKRIPEDVTIQVLCQCREDLIQTSLRALKGAKKVIFHLYNSTSPKQRLYVFNATKESIRELAIKGIEWLKLHMQPLVSDGTKIQLEYSPESFTSTELDFALEVCEAVTTAWKPSIENKIILNLPATVEYATPNVHADQIEWMCRNLTRRNLTIVSLHTHNDRGTGVAATELGLLAGADRVEGTLFGNGERTGNLDIITVALNMHTQGITIGLDFSNLPAIRELYERCTRMSVHPRHPYSGDLVFTAFSGSHQDAIKKSLPHQNVSKPWDVIYIPIDPADIGRNYKEIIRITSQSGKGGVAFILDTEFGFQLPKEMHKEVGKIINHLADLRGTELTPTEIFTAFRSEYFDTNSPLELLSFSSTETDSLVTCKAVLTFNGNPIVISAQGNGPINAFVQAIRSVPEIPPFDVQSYAEHSLGAGATAKAVSYIQLQFVDGGSNYGAGIDTNIELASIKAVVSALNRTLRYTT
jgi:2-isopropylmalate synthase